MENFTIENKIVALFGKRNSGKSRLLKHLVNCEKDLFKNSNISTFHGWFGV